jgi:hypothetical protein
MLINEKTWDFIRQHANDDVRKLALQGAKDAEVDLQMALQQIAGRQTARRKLPSWASVDGVVYPPHLNMEQCSSEQTARYKENLALKPSPKGEGSVFVDLTGGFGVDFYWLSQGFQHRCYVEQNEQLCAISSHNFELLGLECSVCCSDTATHLTTMPHVDLIYMDPARRNEHGGRAYGIEDCSPNVLELLPLLMEKASRVMLKLSPMLDWRKAVEDLKYVSEVHIVSVDNECKELLLLLDQERSADLRVVCVNDDSCFEFFPGQGKIVPEERNDFSLGEKRPFAIGETAFLYEPNASIMKAGCFEEVEQGFPVQQISQNSHLFLSSVEIEDFPGRRFQISSISSMNKQELRTALKEVERANISVRNFPLSADQLRKKLKLKDGGDVYIFATTMSDGEHRLFICRKIG